MLINDLNERIKEKIYKETSKKQKETSIIKEVKKYNSKIKSIQNKEFVKNYIDETIKNVTQYKVFFKQLNNGVLDKDFLIEEMIRNDKKGLSAINLILNYSDGVQIKEENIKKILKKSQKSDKYLSTDSIIKTILSTQKNLDFLINEESIFFENFNSLIYLRKNKEIVEKLNDKILRKINDLLVSGFSNNKKYLYDNFCVNKKLKKEYFDMKCYLMNDYIDIKHILSNQNLSSELIEYLLEKNLITEENIKNDLSNANLGLSKEFLIKYHKKISDNLILRSLNNDDAINYINSMKKNGTDFKKNQNHKEILIKKNYDYNFYKGLYGNDSIYYINKETKEFKFEILNDEFNNYKNYEEFKNDLLKNDLIKVINLNNKLNHLIKETNIPEKYILKYKLLLEYVNQMNTNNFKEEDKSLITLADNQYLPRNLYNESFINDCINNKNVDILSKQIKTFKDYNDIKSKNLPLSEYREFIFLSSKNYIFLDNMNKKEYQIYLNDLLSLEYPIKINDEMVETLNNFSIYKEEQKEIKLDYGLSI